MNILPARERKYVWPLFLGSLLCLLSSGCSRDSSDSDSRKDSAADSWRGESSPVPSPEEQYAGDGQTDRQLQADPSGDPNPARTGASANEPSARADRLRLEKYSFRFHKESRQEICGDWDYFVYKGEMTLSGRIVSAFPVDMTDPDFEMTLITPLDSYAVPATYEREDHGDGYVEKVIKRKGRGQVFQIKGFRLEDDDLVYRNDDDLIGVYKNHGPLLSATFDLQEETFKISIEREDYTAYDVEPGEEFEFHLSLARANPDLDDFDQTAIWTYQGKPINSDDYTYDGDCP